MQHTLDIIQVVAFLSAFLASFSRLFVATRPFWSMCPAWLQTFAPALVPALATAAQGLTGAKSWTDLGVLFIVCGAMLLPGLPSNRSAAKLKSGDAPTKPPSNSDLALALAITNDTAPKAKNPSIPPFASCLCIALLVFLPSCALFAAAAPYLAEAAVIIADAGNAVSAAEATRLIDPELIARARAALAAAAKADDGLHDLTAEQLDASLVDFRACWADIQRVYAAKRIGAAEGAVGLPVPLAVRRAHK